MNTQSPTAILDAARTPVGRRNGGLSSVHPSDLLGVAQNAIFARTGVDPALVQQAVGGCVTQIGEQSFNVTRTAWLAAGLPMHVGASTVDAQCGSGQQATNLGSALVASGNADLVLTCGVETMSRTPLGSNSTATAGRPINRNYRAQYEFISQFAAAERIAEKWGVSRHDADEFALLSQTRAAAALAEDRFAGQLVSVDAPILGADGKPTDASITVTVDEGPRASTLETLGTLKPLGDNAVHTAGSSSQVSDGAAAILLGSTEKAHELGLTPRALIVDSTLIGVDPVMMLTGPIDVTKLLLERNKMTTADIDVFEINEAFASVVLAWQRELDVDIDKINPNGGAIALGHPLGATGAILITKALNELERIDGEFALIAMCTGGGMGTGTLIRRIR